MDDASPAVLFWIRSIKTLDVRENDQEVCFREHRYQGSKPVVVPETDLFYCDRVVLVHHGYDPLLQQAAESVACVQILLPVCEIILREQYLAYQQVVRGEEICI